MRCLSLAMGIGTIYHLRYLYVRSVRLLNKHSLVPTPHICRLRNVARFVIDKAKRCENAKMHRPISAPLLLPAALFLLPVLPPIDTSCPPNSHP
jgi:hypothetical protein